MRWLLSILFVYYPLSKIDIFLLLFIFFEAVKNFFFNF